MKKLTIGQKVRVLRNQTEHGFEIGEIATYVGVDTEFDEPVMLFSHQGRSGTEEYSMNEDEYTTNLELLIDWEDLESQWEESDTYTGSSAFEWFKTEITKRLNNPQ